MSNLSKKKILELQISADKIRIDVLNMTFNAQSGHPGGSFSIAEVISYLYFHGMNYSKKNYKHPDRDRFVLSKGHCCPAVYSALSVVGVVPRKEIPFFRQINHMLQGHPSVMEIPGIEATTGSLGQGFSAAVGIALAGKIDNKKYRVYCALGDGETQEGQIWEAAMSAAHFKLDNLTVFVDHNNLQIDGLVENIMNVMPLKEKFESFGWNSVSINGHNLNEINDAVEKAKTSKKPFAIIMETIKGKGVSFMEGKTKYHGKALTSEEMELAIQELNAKIELNEKNLKNLK